MVELQLLEEMEHLMVQQVEQEHLTILQEQQSHTQAVVAEAVVDQEDQADQAVVDQEESLEDLQHLHQVQLTLEEVVEEELLIQVIQEAQVVRV